ncbi:MAG: hypothetical protein HPY65_13690 [Syntrophaceae bacterium]|nr:hypothetical protein [Syntrophaceae bacterium]
MRNRRGPFTKKQICDGMDVPRGKDRDQVQKALRDFARRGEIAVVHDKHIRRQTATRWRFVAGVRLKAKPGDNKDKILKAMRMISFQESFAVSDIERMTGAGRSHIDKLVSRLLQEGHLRREGFRARSSSYGREALYRVVDTNRFRLEVME